MTKTEEKLAEHGVSKTKAGYCNNAGCDERRRHGSAYCQPCSDKHKAAK